MDVRRYDQRAARNDPAASRAAPSNPAGIRRVPNLGTVYFIMKDGQVDQVVVPVEGPGMWGAIYGFLALAPDGNTVRGLTYYGHKETPGLGAEISNPGWLDLWRGRLGYDNKGEVAIKVIRPMALSGNTKSREQLAQRFLREAEVLATMRHRGPDASASLAHGGAWLGHTRLAIIDLARRSTPESLCDG